MLDFGVWLAPFVMIAIGALTGVLYVRAVRYGSLTAKLFLAYMYMFLLMSPLHSGFGSGNSLQILVCLTVATILMKLWRPGAAEVRPHAVRAA